MDVNAVSAERFANDMNVLAGFLGARDVPELTQAALRARYGFHQADVMALFGGSILAGGDVLAQAMRAEAARCYVIVGGAGHTTETFRERVHELCPELPIDPDASEAQIFESYLERRHGLAATLLETRSTNCGNNITYLLDLLRDRGIGTSSVILSQDATMQRRMAAGLAHEAPGTTGISFATYATKVVVDTAGKLAFEEAPLGMWKMDRYLELLMGEIPRLADDERGYGPLGANHIAHVDIPDEVRQAWLELRRASPSSIRSANSAFAG